jgi:RNA recognition motif
MRIYIGNLPFDADAEALAAWLDANGVTTARTIQVARRPGNAQNRGFAFFDVQDAEAARVLALNGREMSGRKLAVAEARRKAERFRKDA